MKDWYPNTSIIHNVKTMPMIHPGNNDTVIPITIYKPAGMPELLRQRLTGSVHEWLTRLVPKHIYKQNLKNLKTMAAPSAQSQERSKPPASKQHLHASNEGNGFAQSQRPQKPSVIKATKGRIKRNKVQEPPT